MSVSTGGDVVQCRVDERAEELYRARINGRFKRARELAYVGVVTKPLADAPGAMEASPATWWDYFHANMRPVSFERCRDRANREVAGQTGLELFNTSEKTDEETNGGVDLCP